MGRTGLNNSAFAGARLGGSGFGNSASRSSSFSHVGFGGSSFSHNGFGNSWRGGGWGGRGWGGRGFGCCGFGFGFGFGYGFGFGFGYPYWFGYPYGLGFGYGLGWGFGGWGYPSYYYPPYAYPDAPPPYGPDVNYDQPPDDGGYSNSSDIFNGAPLSAPAGQTWLGSPNTNPPTLNVAESTPTVLVYLKDGSMVAASDYWLADGKFHYRVNYAGDNVVDLNQLDLQRTVDENAKRGIRFSLKPAPDAAPAGPDSSSSDKDKDSAPAATPATTPEPAHEFEAASQPAS